ncbi:hypothetical protein D9M69_461230 [compost metagenome]
MSFQIISTPTSLNRFLIEEVVGISSVIILIPIEIHLVLGEINAELISAVLQ